MHYPPNDTLACVQFSDERYRWVEVWLESTVAKLDTMGTTGGVHVRGEHFVAKQVRRLNALLTGKAGGDVR